MLRTTCRAVQRPLGTVLLPEASMGLLWGLACSAIQTWSSLFLTFCYPLSFIFLPALWPFTVVSQALAAVSFRSQSCPHQGFFPVSAWGLWRIL